MSYTYEFLKLQNGSDIRGVAVAGVPSEEVTLTPAAVEKIGAAFVRFLRSHRCEEKKSLRIAVGHDSRISANVLEKAVVQGLCAQDATVFLCGLASTPAMFMSTVFEDMKMDGAIMITASHLPYNRNGLKFFTRQGGLEKEEIKEILRAAARSEHIEKKTDSRVYSLALMPAYAAYLRKKIATGLGCSEADRPLQHMHIVVDAGNGAGGFFAEQVLAPLGADIEGSRFLEPDGMFPNHVPNPEAKAAMAAIQQAVRDSHADLGLIFDTDVDRMSAVLHDGEPINRNKLIAMMAAILAPQYAGSTIVTDSVTSDELTAFLEDTLHLVHHRYRRGYKNVINECIRLNDAGTVSPLAIETSGHGALKENYYLDDGAYLAVKLIVAVTAAKEAGKDSAHYIAALKEPLESCEYRLAIRETDDAPGYGKLVLAVLKQRAEEIGIHAAEPSYEGVRLLFDHGWALLRMSLHDPQMPLNLESRKVGGCREMGKIIKSLLKGFAYLDVSEL
ncbi:phosphomannomutase/phosphoglucomutase [uncultured Megasphaera sp.]|uniref:phosphomannomutase/phosphoglucomutase n=1 Tax=uncultured Megasphaera sp. TaxID=165188 RepID=UPI0025944731|nr:phosphomannomutase/phosphoglucomutase [uncultured Megasphaera sp.]